MIIICPECGRGISSFADSCPNCGLPRSMFFKAANQRSINNMEFVDLGLPSGTLWATKNVGAKSPYDKGMYFAWADSEVKEDYTWENYKYFLGFHIAESNKVPRLSKYTGHIRLGIVDSISFMEPCDDPASVYNDMSSMTPSYGQFKELFENCKMSREYTKGVNGIQLVGPNGNKLFLIATGYITGTKILKEKCPVFWHNRCNSYGYDNAGCFSTTDFADNYCTFSPERCCGVPIRPVRR